MANFLHSDGTGASTASVDFVGAVGTAGVRSMSARLKAVTSAQVAGVCGAFGGSAAVFAELLPDGKEDWAGAASG
ncbi:hypothetical protein [Paraburkholderia phosphatilytica]|uniref:hypothetical protein n=1 Tax=Paraburkholderia phosphatilytica TaxID=2282883 RepID=UPI000F5EDF3E|nr:hypothetical protein [Paraburkholderia phosphatilytica]